MWATTRSRIKLKGSTVQNIWHNTKNKSDRMDFEKCHGYSFAFGFFVECVSVCWRLWKVCEDKNYFHASLMNKSDMLHDMNIIYEKIKLNKCKIIWKK